LIAERRAAHPSSGERNFTVENAERAIAAVIDTFEAGATLDETDGVSLEFADWRFNLRKSNTEPLVRLNVEARGGAVDIEARVAGNRGRAARARRGGDNGVLWVGGVSSCSGIPNDFLSCGLGKSF
jgi:phosphomannomutase